MTGPIHDIRRWFRFNRFTAVAGSVLLFYLGALAYTVYLWRAQGSKPLTDHDMLVIILILSAWNTLK